jgi:hypothetical protein
LNAYPSCAVRTAPLVCTDSQIFKLPKLIQEDGRAAVPDDEASDAELENSESSESEEDCMDCIESDPVDVDQDATTEQSCTSSDGSGSRIGGRGGDAGGPVPAPRSNSDSDSECLSDSDKAASDVDAERTSVD